MWIINARLVLAERVIERGALRTEGGLIAEIREGDEPTGASVLDARGLTLIPGLIDVHGDMIERELEPRPGTRFGTDLAVLELDKRLSGCGVTTAYASLSFADGLGLRSESRALEIIAELTAMRPALMVDHRIHARYEVSNTDSQPPLRELLVQGAVSMLSLMDHTPGQGQYRDMETYVAYLAKWLGRDEQSVRELTLARMAQGRTSLGPEGISGAQVWRIGAELGQLARDLGVAVASHDDDTPQKVRLVQDMGATISEFPVTLEAAQAAREQGLWVVMGAPNALRGQSHSGNLSAMSALEAGVLDALASDYSPMSMLQAAWQIARQGRLDLSGAIRLITAGPAACANLLDRGRLEVGLRADLVLVEDLHRPRVRMTLRGGQMIYHDGRLTHPSSQQAELRSAGR
ncbi:alpha-D-ribose 1-methylphosphonate 5-triphosphate diphosphatase [Deinococcus sp.]|uniref:alpha-D-ribose 1-methylphosphonate 5-triphosphate diphosphatase n=1 Tax=Deinococcus sp. TaxID=47478 RepID=UPI0025ECD6F9|nr:alpha-D-ribose 1-methylphosphonate 5-triphosphate diphosphatase [Deinococcus sp.]